MKKIILLFVPITVLFSSCLTTHTYNLQLPDGSTGIESNININYSEETLDYEDDYIKATLSIKSRQYISLQVRNKTDSVVELLNKNNTFNYKSRTARLVPGNLNNLEASTSNIPSILITPNTSIRVNYYSAEAISTVLNSIRNWVPVEYLSESSAVFEYATDEHKGYIIFSNLGSNITSIEVTESTNSQYSKLLGHINKKIFVSHLFFIQNTNEEKIMKIARNKAYEEAKQLYGDDIVMKNVSYSGNWSLSSLLYYFDGFGWIETVTFSADIFGK